MVACNEGVTYIEHGSDVHRIEKLIGCDLAVAHRQRRDEAAWCAGLQRPEHDRSLLTVDLGVLGRKLPRALLAGGVVAAGQLDHDIVSTQVRCGIPFRRRDGVNVALDDVFGSGDCRMLSCRRVPTQLLRSIMTWRPYRKLDPER